MPNVDCPNVDVPDEGCPNDDCPKAGELMLLVPDGADTADPNDVWPNVDGAGASLPNPEGCPNTDPDAVCPNVEGCPNEGCPKPDCPNAGEGFTSGACVDEPDPNEEAPPSAAATANAEGPLFAKAPNPDAGLIGPDSNTLDPNADPELVEGVVSNEPNIAFVPRPPTLSDVSLPPRESPPKPSFAVVPSSASEAMASSSGVEPGCDAETADCIALEPKPKEGWLKAVPGDAPNAPPDDREG